MAAVWDAEGRLYGMVEWGKPNSFFEPLYPLISAGFYILFGDRLFFWRLMHVIMGTLLVLLVYDIGKRAFNDERIGLFAALYATVYPHFVFYSWTLMAEPLLVLLLAAGFWAYFRLLGHPRWYWAVWIGLFFGAFTLTRSFLIAFFPLIPLFILVFLKGRQRWKYAALAAFGFILALAPWVYRNYRIHHQFVLLSTRGGYNIWMRNNPYYIEDELAAMGVKFSPEQLEKLKYRDYLLGYPHFTSEQGELERNRILTQEGLKFILANPGFFLKMCWIRFKWVIGYKGIGMKGPLLNSISLLFYGPILLGFIVSFFLGWRRLNVALPLWSIICYFVLFYSLTHEGMRYRVPVDPYMILLAVFSAVFIYDRMVRKSLPVNETPYAGKS